MKLHQRSVDRRHRPVVRALSLALMLATWRGPIPCIHFHDNRLDAAPATMARHVRAYHAADPVEHAATWHVHLMLPQDVLRLGECPSPAPEEVPEDPLLAHQTVVELSGSTVSLSWLLAAARHAGALDGACAGDGPSPSVSLRPPAASVERPPVSFSTTLLSAAPLCAVTGVALC